MTGCRVRTPGERTAFVRAFLAGWLVFLATTAVRADSLRIAQAGPPKPLAPPARLVPLPVPATPEVPASRTAPRRVWQPPAGSPSDPPPADDRRRSGVDVVPLTPLGPASVGLMGEAEGGFGVSLWRGTKRGLVEALLPRLPVKTSSRAARALAIRLLSTRAEAPGGLSRGANMLTLRVERLVALGAIVTASRLAALAAADRVDQSLARAAVEASFLHNDNAGACQMVRRHARRFKQVYWRRARAFCLTLSGDSLRAGLMIDALRERAGNASEAFFALMEALTSGEDAEVESLPDPSGLDLAMMRAARARVPADVLSSDRPAVLRAAADSPNADLGLRLVAAERAYGYGAIDADTLGEIYDAVAFDADAMAEPLRSAEADWGPRGRALLLRSARAAGDDAARARLLRQGYDLAREKGGWDVLLAASVPLLQTMRPDPGLLWFAHDAVLGLLSAGDVARAQLWLDLAEADEDRAREAKIRLWGIGRFVGPAGHARGGRAGFLHGMAGSGSRDRHRSGPREGGPADVAPGGKGWQHRTGTLGIASRRRRTDAAGNRARCRLEERLGGGRNGRQDRRDGADLPARPGRTGGTAAPIPRRSARRSRGFDGSGSRAKRTRWRWKPPSPAGCDG